MVVFLFLNSTVPWVHLTQNFFLFSQDTVVLIWSILFLTKKAQKDLSSNYFNVHTTSFVFSAPGTHKIDHCMVPEISTPFTYTIWKRNLSFFVNIINSHEAESLKKSKGCSSTNKLSLKSRQIFNICFLLDENMDLSSLKMLKMKKKLVSHEASYHWVKKSQVFEKKKLLAAFWI